MRILVVDDSKTIRFMLTHLLNELGYDQIAEAAEVEAAMNLVLANPPDLIFSDYNMPGRSGLDFLKMVRQHPVAAKVPFIMVTTMHDKKVIIDGVKAGLQYYLLKPVEKNVLFEKLTALAESHHIQAPRKAAAAIHHVIESAAVPVTKIEPAQSGDAIAPGLITAIREHFFLVFDGELTMQDFQTWATANILPHLPKTCNIASAANLLEILRRGAAEGIDSILKQCNTDAGTTGDPAGSKTS